MTHGSMVQYNHVSGGNRHDDDVDDDDDDNEVDGNDASRNDEHEHAVSGDVVFLSFLTEVVVVVDDDVDVAARNATISAWAVTSFVFST
jgi:hypothetical protein